MGCMWDVVYVFACKIRTHTLWYTTCFILYKTTQQSTVCVNWCFRVDAFLDWFPRFFWIIFSLDGSQRQCDAESEMKQNVFGVQGATYCSGNWMWGNLMVLRFVSECVWLVGIFVDALNTALRWRLSDDPDDSPHVGFSFRTHFLEYSLFISRFTKYSFSRKRAQQNTQWWNSIVENTSKHSRVVLLWVECLTPNTYVTNL